jgi:D-alanine-D-alanine ligase-like ATP-grasp enzyme
MQLHSVPETPQHFPFLTRTLLQLFVAGELSNVQEVIVEPLHGFVARITYKNGLVRVLRAPNLGINRQGSVAVVRDKAYTKVLLERLGYKTPRGRVFLSDAYFALIQRKYEWANPGVNAVFGQAFEYAEVVLGYPCFVKPVSGSQGRGVRKCIDHRELELAISEAVARGERKLLVEQAIDLPDYRIVVLRNRVISCYRRYPLCVVGNGRDTVIQLLRTRQSEFVERGRDTVIDYEDQRIQTGLARLGYSLDTVLAVGEEVQIQDVSNLSVGGEARECIGEMHSHWASFCVDLVRSMGLVFCGVDVACADLGSAATEYAVLELNSAPGLDAYGAGGVEQEDIVRRLYREVLNEPPNE